jgi:hypothetical protein
MPWGDRRRYNGNSRRQRANEKANQHLQRQPLELPAPNLGDAVPIRLEHRGREREAALARDRRR